MSALIRVLRAPGAMYNTVATAPTRYPDEKKLNNTDLDIKDAPGYQVKAKPGLLDRGLDATVHASGSPAVFVFIQLLLLAWAFLGIPFGQTDIWPVIISDAQAILSYIFDSFLMRQQLNGYNENLTVAAELRSRNSSSLRMMRALSERVGDDRAAITDIMQSKIGIEIQLPSESWFTRIVSVCAKVLGHILFVAAYWVGILVWLGLGPLNDWSNQWQLDLNSATSALMVFIFSFLAILREQHVAYLRSCLDAVYRVDETLERCLRALTNDNIPNEEVVISPIKINGLQRAITYYADVVGTLVGIALLIIVMAIWVAIGPALQFNANWWLLIGTYAGLVGLNDGFVLRNMQALHRRHENPLYASLGDEDAETIRAIGLEVPTVPAYHTKTLSYRISEYMNGICGHEVTVLLGVLLIVGLLIGASVMKWTETGQLLCNIPPSVIESFFMIILITGHNASDGLRRVDLRNMFERRRILLAYADAAEEWFSCSGASEEKRMVTTEVAGEV